MIKANLNYSPDILIFFLIHHIFIMVYKKETPIANAFQLIFKIRH